MEAPRRGGGEPGQGDVSRRDRGHAQGRSGGEIRLPGGRRGGAGPELLRP